MKVRACLCLIVGVAALGGWSAARAPLTAESLGLDFWRVGALEDHVRSGEDRFAELEREDEIIMDRTAARHRILTDLLAERVTLDEAGQGFLALNRTDPTGLEFLRTHHPAGTDSDRALRQVVIHLASHLAAGSGERAGLLKCELSATRPHISWPPEGLHPDRLPPAASEAD